MCVLGAVRRGGAWDLYTPKGGPPPLVGRLSLVVVVGLLAPFCESLKMVIDHVRRYTNRFFFPFSELSPV